MPDHSGSPTDHLRIIAGSLGKIHHVLSPQDDTLTATHNNKVAHTRQLHCRTHIAKIKRRGCPARSFSRYGCAEHSYTPTGCCPGGRAGGSCLRGFSVAGTQGRLVGFQQTSGGILPALNQTGEGFLLKFVLRYWAGSSIFVAFSVESWR